ncbi:hypothetical protein E1212_24805 [Jiangella ureilytica]|uniref:Uncharacterized protein n=1 Tax=Jiangella ureilytica TaxID=2530374 RepID=A0A4V2XVZ0_9ACTN|nr:hypothetical protein [Jiangella ureilytica]TDC47275.1 hypothetical protein E1212_24805 [Jiangella ureilytica]
MPVLSWLRRRPAGDGATPAAMTSLPAVAGAAAGSTLSPSAPPAAIGVTKPRREPIVTKGEVALAFSTLFVLAAVVLGSVLVEPPDVVHAVAQFVHLACVVVGLGSVLAVDWFGLRWQFGKATLREVVTTASALAAPIWLGMGGLMLSGMLLSPDFGSTAALVKIGAVGVAGVVGVLALAVSRRLAARTVPSRRLLRAGLVMAVTSQLAWWTATVIGFLNRT